MRFRRFLLHYRLQLKLLTCVILIASGVTTSMAYVHVQNRVTDQANKNFEKLAHSYATKLSEHMERYGDLLYATRALFATTNVDAATWKHFVQSQSALERYDGMKSIAYAQAVTQAELPAYSETLKSQNTQIRIHPDRLADEYIILTYYEQIATSEPIKTTALGFDLLSDRDRTYAIDAARRSGTVTATAPIDLVTNGHAGLLLLLPLTDRQNIPRSKEPFGYSIIAFDVAGLIKKTIGPMLEQDQSSLSIIDTTDTPRQLYSKDRTTSGRKVAQSIPVKVADRTWSITFQTPTSSLITIRDRAAPVAVLIAGVVFMLLVCVMLYIFRLRKKMSSTN